MAKEYTKVIAFRVNNSVYDRLDLRARKKGVKLGTYIRDFVEKDLFRTREG
jgi:predicted DNA-binding protein